MSTTVGSVTLDEDMAWTDEYKHPLVSASVEPTLGGGVYIQEFVRYEVGRPITLESTENFGFQRKSTVVALKALADVPGATYALTVTSNGETLSKTVRFRNEESSGPVEFDPLQVRDGLHTDTDWYRGTLKMMVV